MFQKMWYQFDYAALHAAEPVDAARQSSDPVALRGTPWCSNVRVVCERLKAKIKNKTKRLKTKPNRNIMIYARIGLSLRAWRESPSF